MCLEARELDHELGDTNDPYYHAVERIDILYERPKKSTEQNNQQLQNIIAYLKHKKFKISGLLDKYLIQQGFVKKNGSINIPKAQKYKYKYMTNDTAYILRKLLIKNK